MATVDKGWRGKRTTTDGCLIVNLDCAANILWRCTHHRKLDLATVLFERDDTSFSTIFIIPYTMNKVLLLRLGLWVGTLPSLKAFTAKSVRFPEYQNAYAQVSRTAKTRLGMSEIADPLRDMSEERKANLFQFLLRDLEVEGVPLLGCDADQPSSFQAALWSTMAQLSESEGEEKACMVFENIPVDALRVFVDDFILLKLQPRLMDQLPELARFSLSLVGKGVGPAIVVECSEWTDGNKQNYMSIRNPSPEPNEWAWQAAMKTFVSRMIVGNEVCPHMKDNAMGPSGLEFQGITAGSIAYRLVGSPNVCDIMSAFWSCMCELLSVSAEELAATVMSLPPVPEGMDPTSAHNRFSAVSELISRNLFLYRGEDVLELWHMHPYYDRDLVHPVDKPQHGHLPPTSWLPAMLRAASYTNEADSATYEQLKLQNYQRRSPLPSVVIKRVSQVEAAASPDNAMVQLDVGNGRMELVSGIGAYSRNVIRMAMQGEEALYSALASEISMTK